MGEKLLIALITLTIVGAGMLVPGCTSAPPGVTTQDDELSGRVKIIGSTSVQPYATELADSFSVKYPGADALVSGGGSGAGIKAAQDGTAQIGMSSRELTEEEKASGLRAIVIGYDGIIVVVNPANPLSSLTRQQIKDIFAGRVTNWKDVGGSDAPVTVVTRESGSGTRAAFQEIVMGETNLTDRAVTLGSTGGITQTVSGDRNAIGYISYGSLDDSVKVLAVDGVAPSADAIKDGTYPIRRPFLFVTKGEPTDPVTKAFIEYTLSEEGQKLLAEGRLVTV
ncbi:phosphate ABC transporter substrate-binding protein [Methanocella arvoryzae]|uniref:High-affinity phosphate ABC-type import system,periplasmic component n=1 Tax=Methanocella arvoryzae (strain DSM 22066 / NBRC 105507 / MRE50) TaxID=351160 RepID=Q0W1F7_METAR|nr:high-affinity phosphate ABC-type import system,periplasmic component [Methanocella arvoryzae MRE50]